MAGFEPAFSRVAEFQALVAAARSAARGHRSSRDVASFLLDLEPQVLELERELLLGLYRPRPFRTFAILDPKPRTISAAAFRDRVVHHALCAEIGPVLERGAVESSFACRRGKGVLAALRHVRRQVVRRRFALKLDVRHFFESLSHDVLRRLLRRRLRDERLAWLVDVFLNAGAPGSPPGRGLPIGNLTSQHFANFYLGPLDRLVTRGFRLGGYCRYMDDVLVFHDSKEALWEVLAAVEDLLGSRLDLELRPEVTRLLPVTEGVPFLGFAVFPGTVRLDPHRVRRWRRRMRLLARALDKRSMSEQDAQRVADSLVGWAEHGNTRALRRAWVARRWPGGPGRGGFRARTG